MSTTYNIDPRLSTADQLGLVKAEISRLQELKRQLKADVVACGETVHGDFYDATPVFANVTSVDWKTIALKFEPSRQLIAAHSTRSVRTSVRVSSRKAEVA